mgnify:CR=1 FL=1
MEFVTEENKAKVIINAAPLQDAFRLKAVIQKALLNNGIKIEDIKENDIFNILMALDSSEEVFNAMFDCLKKSSYNGIKITKETFEPEETRGDLYEVFFYCLKVNIYPFLRSLCSRFGIQFGASAELPKQL